MVLAYIFPLNNNGIQYTYLFFEAYEKDLTPEIMAKIIGEIKNIISNLQAFLLIRGNGTFSLFPSLSNLID